MRALSLPGALCFLAWTVVMCFLTPGAGTAQEETPLEAGAPAPAEALRPPEDEAPVDGAAAGAPAELPTGGEAVAPERSEMRGIGDVVHAVISRGVLATAEWLDSFFDDPRYEVEENRTRLKTGLDYVLEHGSAPDFSVPLSVKIALPHFQRETRLVFVGAPDKDLESDTTTGGTAVNRLPGAQGDNVTTALDYFLAATDRRNVAVRIGFRFRDSEPELFVLPRYRLLVPLDLWALRFTQSFRWWTEFGWEEITTVDFERPVGEALFFRTTAQGAWTQEENGYFYSLSFVLRQALSSRRALQYEWINNFQTRPRNQVEEHLFLVRYRQKIWRDWLFFEIAPQASFRRDRDFDLTPGILFRIETIFGRYEGTGV